MHPRPLWQTTWVSLNITCPKRENEPSQIILERLNAGCSLLGTIGMDIDAVPSRRTILRASRSAHHLLANDNQEQRSSTVERSTAGALASLVVKPPADHC